MSADAETTELLKAVATTLAGEADESRKAIGRHITDVNDFAVAIGRAEEVLRHIGAGELATAIAVLTRACAAIQTRNSALEARFEAMQEKLDTVQRELDTVRSEASTDPLTGLANRRLFEQCLSEFVARAAATRAQLILIVCDIDDFKRFNDMHGHLVGDQVLRYVARVLLAQVRDGDVVARCGGEEFAVILPDCELDGALAIAERIRATLAGKVITKRSTKERIGSVSLSLGVQPFRPGMAAADFFDAADKLLYTAKRTGKNRVATVDEPAEGRVA